MSAALVSGMLLVAGTLLPATFPEPETLQDNVRFWERVYAEWRSDQVVFHDSSHLGVVYRVMDLGELRVFPKPADRNLWREQVKARRERINAELDTITAALGRLSAAKAKGRLEPAALDGLDREVYQALVAADALEQLAGAAGRLRWQYGLADRFAGGLLRFDFWRAELEPIFLEEGVPTELLALGFVESLFDPTVSSHVGAAGIFQFMTYTAKDYRLARTELWDERRDPLRAGRAAARMLRSNYRRLGSWPLALTGYNHGPSGVARAVKTVGSDDLTELIRKYDGPAWGFASKNFYAEFLAARRVLDRRAELFGDWVPAAPIQAHEVRLPQPVALSLLEKEGCVTAEQVQALNPALLEPVLTSQRALPPGYPLRVPSTLEAAAFVACAAAAAIPVPTPPDVVVATSRDYRVQRGDTLSAIAQRYGTTVRALRKLNDLGPDGYLYAGQLLRIPGRGAGAPGGATGTLLLGHPEP